MSTSLHHRARIRRRVRGLAIATALAAGTALPGAPGAAAESSDAPAVEAPSLKVLSYNTFLFSKLVYPTWGQDHRAQAIPAADFFQGQDVVVLQEAFDNGSSDTLQDRAAARYPHQTPVLGRSRSGWDATGGAYSDIALEDGGVTVLSTWPIIRREQVVYEAGCGADWLSNKGFVYAVLDVRGTRVHVVGTHLQAGDSACGEGEPRSVRAEQLRQMDAFLDAKRIPADEQVVVAGDFNVDSRGAEYPDMLENAGLAGAEVRDGHPHSYDPAENTIAGDRSPGGSPSDLDYVLHRNGHVRPAAWTNTVIKEQSDPWTPFGTGARGTFTNLSDHYPVTAHGTP